MLRIGENMSDIYATDKILYHPTKLRDMRWGVQCYPTQIHLMPDNRCNHNCSFCAYRITGSKNNETFDRKSRIPLEIIIKILDDFWGMEGKAVEITGGGEPLLYPHFKEMIDRILHWGFDYALVTNGTLLTEEMAIRIAPKITWARISIDAGTKETYAKIRHCGEEEFDRALASVTLMRKHAQNPQFKLGVGFVVNNDNWEETYEACRLAKEAGADNVRLSAIFHPDGLAYFNEETIKGGTLMCKKAEELNDEAFTVYNLFDERIKNVIIGKQNYRFCGTKEMLCVIGGDCKVYYCCSLAFNKKGYIGDLSTIGFKELWDSEGKHKQFSELNASITCNHQCLYEKRNKTILKLLRTDVPHVNFF